MLTYFFLAKAEEFGFGLKAIHYYQLLFILFDLSQKQIQSKMINKDYGT